MTITWPGWNESMDQGECTATGREAAVGEARQRGSLIGYPDCLVINVLPVLKLLNASMHNVGTRQWKSALVTLSESHVFLKLSSAYEQSWRRDVPRTLCSGALPPSDVTAPSALLTCRWNAWLPPGGRARRPSWLRWAAERGRATLKIHRIKKTPPFIESPQTATRGMCCSNRRLEVSGALAASARSRARRNDLETTPRV